LSDPQVLIVGAGPVGLTAALALQSLGVGCRIIEKNAQRVTESRALGIQARTLEMFERVGMAERLLAAGIIGNAVRIFLDGEEKVRVGFEQLDTPYPCLLVLAQSETERLLGEEFHERGGQVERLVELTAIVQDESGVTCTLRHVDGRQETCRADYVLACDGAHSTVRKQVGLAFAGEPLPGTFVLADVLLDCDWPRDEGRVYAGKRGFLFNLPVGAKHWRVIAPLPPDEYPAPPEISLSLVQQLCDERGPPGLRPHDPAWLSVFHISSRIVERFRVGRVFLAGDAAHIHSPAGGQGMNTGMQEVFNLAWKLAMRLRGQASDALLETYDAERRPHAQSLLLTTHRATQVMMSTSSAASWLKQSVLAVAGTFDLLPEKIAGQISDLKINYRHGPLSAEESIDLGKWLQAYLGSQQPGPQSRLAFSLGPHAGDRAPDAEGLSRTPGEHHRLFDCCGNNLRHQVLIFAGESTTHARLAQLDQTVRDLNARDPQLLQAALIRCGLGQADDQTLFDTQRLAHARYGARYECLYLIRPDGHIAFRSQPVDLAALDRYWARAYGS
jgi:2-polyprenyl-6-methoxyphenol hydroxylase-like FAD-dependent oxidoreductase